MELSLFGSELYPLRPSRLGVLLECTMRVALEFADPQIGSREAGSAAQTGSILHAMVQAFHEGKPVEDTFRAACLQWPEGVASEASAMFEGYASDPRNAKADIVKCEFPVRLRLPAGPGEPDIHIAGTLDQLRRVDGVLRVFDLKTGKSPGWQQIHHHAVQIAAYTLAAAQTIGEPVEPGSLILGRAYLTRAAGGTAEPPRVFWSMPFDAQGAEVLLRGVVDAVRRVRRGEIRPAPGSACDFCPVGGLQECLQFSPTTDLAVALSVV